MHKYLQRLKKSSGRNARTPGPYEAEPVSMSIALSPRERIPHLPSLEQPTGLVQLTLRECGRYERSPPPPSSPQNWQTDTHLPPRESCTDGQTCKTTTQGGGRLQCIIRHWHLCPLGSDIFLVIFFFSKFSNFWSYLICTSNSFL